MGGNPGQRTKVLAYADSKVFSGAEAVFCDVVRGLAAIPGLDVAAAAPAENPELTDGLRSATAADVVPVSSQALPLAAFDLFRPGRLRRAERAIAETDPDVLLVNLPSAEYGALPLRSRRLQCRRIGLLHVPGSPADLGFRLGRARETLARRSLRGLDAVAVLSPSAERSFRERWATGPVDIGRLSLPRPEVQRRDTAAVRAELGLPAGEIVGIAGRISFRQKGQDTFVRAAARLAERRRSVSFAVAGEGRDRERLERLIDAAGLRERFFLLGHVDPIGDFLSAVDVLAIPSRFEGLPVIALEALACGTPGIGTAIDGLRDVWPEPWLIPRDDPRQLADALSSLLDSPEDLVAALLREGAGNMERVTSENPAAAIEALITDRDDA